MNSLQIIGLVLMALGLLWAGALTRQPAPGGPETQAVDPWTKLIEALAKLAEGLAKLFGTRFGAPMVVFLAGLGLFVWGTA